ncbi:MAG: hypothetical protein JSR64_09465 [Nitrospira sp.]|mgnify:FL=1|nr:hypothetical protein [Nitrospira sp.]
MTPNKHMRHYLVACTTINANILVIADAGVERGALHGHIVVGSTPSDLSIEVHFRSPAGGATARTVRTYRQSVDNTTLLELSGTKLVATWVRCRS